jgi:catechol 2,3-dioxygenase-like lactoylglutathione lyase family enzyme
MNINVRSLDHVTLIVADLAASSKFYVDFLGMAEVPRPAFDFPGLWFQAGHSSIHATLADDKAGRAGWGDQGGSSPSRGHHFAFLVEDVESIVEKIRASDYEILVDLKTRPDGAKQIYIADPDGHVVELASV